MSINKQKKIEAYLFAINIYLAISVVLFCVYLFIPVLGGNFSFYPLLIYGSWIGFALVTKLYLKKTVYSKKVEGYQVILYGFYTSSCMLLWFSVEIGLVLSIAIAISCFFYFRKCNNS